MIEQTNSPTTALLKACARNSMIGAETAINNGAEVNVGNSHGNTALHFACMHEDNFSLVNLLFQKDAEANFLNDNDETPLMVTCRWGDCPVQTVKYVFENTVAELINYRDISGDSALNDVICLREDVELATWMLARGATLKSLNTEAIRKLAEHLLQSTLTESDMTLMIEIVEHVCCVEACPELLRQIMTKVNIDFATLSLESLSFLHDYLRTVIKYELEKNPQIIERFKSIQEKIATSLAEKVNEEIQVVGDVSGVRAQVRR